MSSLLHGFTDESLHEVLTDKEIESLKNWESGQGSLSYQSYMSDLLYKVIKYHSKKKSVKAKRGRPITCRYCDHQFSIDKVNRQSWNESKSVCPSCNHVYCDKPKTEIDLLELQEQWLVDRSNTALFDQMIVIMLSYTQSILKKSYSNYIQEPGSLDYYSHTAVSFLVENYLSKPDYRVWGSFAGQLFPKIKQALWGSPEKAIDADSLDYIFDDGNKVNYEDSKRSYTDCVEERYHSSKLVNDLCGLVFAYERECTPGENYLRLIGLRNYVFKGEKATDFLFDVAYEEHRATSGKLQFNETLTLMRNELQKAASISEL
jgi:predicted Zn-ribbon and HTH transcriptional regulator